MGNLCSCAGGHASIRGQQEHSPYIAIAQLCEQVSALAEGIAQARLVEPAQALPLAPHLEELKVLAQSWMAMSAAQGADNLPSPQLGARLAALQDRLERTCGRLAKLRSTSYVGPSGQRKAAEKLSYSLLDTIHAQRSLLAELQIMAATPRCTQEPGAAASGAVSAAVSPTKVQAAPGGPHGSPSHATLPRRASRVSSSTHSKLRTRHSKHAIGSRPSARSTMHEHAPRSGAAPEPRVQQSQQREQRRTADTTTQPHLPRTQAQSAAVQKQDLHQYLLVLSPSPSKSKGPSAEPQWQGTLVPLSAVTCKASTATPQKSLQQKQPGTGLHAQPQPAGKPGASVASPAQTTPSRQRAVVHQSPGSTGRRPREPRPALAASAAALSDLYVKLTSPLRPSIATANVSARGHNSEGLTRGSPRKHLFDADFVPLADGSARVTRLDSAALTAPPFVYEAAADQAAWVSAPEAAPSAPVDTSVQDSDGPVVPPLLLQAAEQDDPVACGRVASLYEQAATAAMQASDPDAADGGSAPSSASVDAHMWYSAAAHWHQRAMQAGQLGSASALGYFMERGLGLESHKPNPTAAVQVYAWAALRGDVTSTNNLARMLAEGKGVGQDAAAARQLFNHAADGGSADAAYNLAYMLLHDQSPHGPRADIGTVTDQDDQRSAAVYWLCKASRSGHREAALLLARTLLSDGRVSDALRELIAAARAGVTDAATLSADVLKGLSARLTERDSLYRSDTQILSLLSDMDKILPPDSFTNTSHPGMGVAGHTHASPRGDTAASRALQATLSHAERADLAACRWYEHAASAGEPQAQHWLANRLWGEGHIQEAMGLWTDAAAQGWAPAHMALGHVMKSSGDVLHATGVHQEPAALYHHRKATQHYRHAADAGMNEGSEHADVLSHSQRRTQHRHSMEAAAHRPDRSAISAGAHAVNTASTARQRGAAYLSSSLGGTDARNPTWTTQATANHHTWAQGYGSHTDTRPGLVDPSGMRLPNTALLRLFPGHTTVKHGAIDAALHTAGQARARLLLFGPPSITRASLADKSLTAGNRHASTLGATFAPSMSGVGMGAAAHTAHAASALWNATQGRVERTPAWLLHTAPQLNAYSTMSGAHVYGTSSWGVGTGRVLRSALSELPGVGVQSSSLVRSKGSTSGQQWFVQ